MIVGGGEDAMKKSGGKCSNRGDSKCKGLGKEHEETRNKWLRQEARRSRRTGRNEMATGSSAAPGRLVCTLPKSRCYSELLSRGQRIYALHHSGLWVRNRLEGMRAEAKRLVRKLFYCSYPSER